MKKNSKLNILLSEPNGYSPRAISILNKIGLVSGFHFSESKFRKILPQANILVVKLGLKIDQKIFDQASNLKAIATNTTGLNHIDLAEAKKRKIAIISLRGHTEFLDKIHATPELTWGLILALIRKIPWAFESVKKRKWDRNKFAGHELNGKVLGILGFGRIGKIISKYAAAFGMEVIACDPLVNEKIMKQYGVKKVALDDLFKKSDILSVHVLHTPAVNKLVKEKHFRLMKPAALFINTARGELTDEKALLKALKNKWIAGVALDVISEEENLNLEQNALWQYAKNNDNLLIVPHLGGAAFEAWQATEEFLAKLVVKHFRT